MENSIYVFAAYAVIWLFTLGYIFSVGQRQNALRKEIEALKAGTLEFEQSQEIQPAMK